MPLRNIVFDNTNFVESDSLFDSLTKPVFLWLVERTDDTNHIYDQFTAIVVTAHSIEEAYSIEPYHPEYDDDKGSDRGWAWGSRPPLKARCIGTALPGMASGKVLIADYKAG